MEYVAFGGQCLIGAVFGVSALSKVRSRTAHAEFVRVTGVLLAALLRRGTGSRAARRAAAVVVAAESAVPILTVAQVLHPFAPVVGSAVAVALLGAFSAALVRALRRGVRTPCRCFGASPTPLGRHHLARNLALLAVAGITGLSVLTSGLTSGAGGLGSAQPAGLALAGGAGLVLAVLVSRLDDLVQLFAPVAGAGSAPKGERHAISRRRNDPGGRAVPVRPAADAGSGQTAAGAQHPAAEPPRPR